MISPSRVLEMLIPNRFAIAAQAGVPEYATFTGEVYLIDGTFYGRVVDMGVSPACVVRNQNTGQVTDFPEIRRSCIAGRIGMKCTISGIEFNVEVDICIDPSIGIVGAVVVPVPSFQKSTGLEGCEPVWMLQHDLNFIMQAKG